MLLDPIHQSSKRVVQLNEKIEKHCVKVEYASHGKSISYIFGHLIHFSFAFVMRLARLLHRISPACRSSIAEGLTDYVYVNIINSEQKSMGHAPVDEIARFVKVRLVARIH